MFVKKVLTGANLALVPKLSHSSRFLGSAIFAKNRVQMAKGCDHWVQAGSHRSKTVIL